MADSDSRIRLHDVDVRTVVAFLQTLPPDTRVYPHGLELVYALSPVGVFGTSPTGFVRFETPVKTGAGK